MLFCSITAQPSFLRLQHGARRDTNSITFDHDVPFNSCPTLVRFKRHQYKRLWCTQQCDSHVYYSEAVRAFIQNKHHREAFVEFVCTGNQPDQTDSEHNSFCIVLANVTNFTICVPNGQFMYAWFVFIYALYYRYMRDNIIVMYVSKDMTDSNELLSHVNAKKPINVELHFYVESSDIKHTHTQDTIVVIFTQDVSKPSKIERTHLIRHSVYLSPTK